MTVLGCRQSPFVGPTTADTWGLYQNLYTVSGRRGYSVTMPKETPTKNKKDDTTTLPEEIVTPDPTAAFADSIDALPMPRLGSGPAVFLYDMKPGQVVNSTSLRNAGYYKRTDTASQAIRHALKRGYLAPTGTKGVFERTPAELPDRATGA